MNYFCLKYIELTLKNLKEQGKKQVKYTYFNAFFGKEEKSAYICHLICRGLAWMTMWKKQERWL